MNDEFFIVSAINDDLDQKNFEFISYSIFRSEISSK
jgi:hypothetical protein